MATERPYPRFRRDIVKRRIVESGEAAYTVHDPLRNSYFRHDELTHQVSSLLDGERLPDDVLAALHEHYPQYAFTREWLDELVDDLRRAGFLEESFTMNEIQRARAREARRKWAPTSFANLLNVQFGVIDPTPAFRLVYPVARVLFTRWFVSLAILAFLCACSILWTEREAVAAGVSTIFTISGGGILSLLALWVILFLIVVAHEFGHGLSCMHFGGQPRRMGFMLFYLMPGMFCDVSDIYFFEKRWHRAAVALAGGYVEILCFTAGTFIWTMTPPDLLIHEIAFKVMLFSGVTGLVFNYNPLIKLDGYYVLMSWLDMPDLRERSFKWIGDLFRGRVLRLPVTPERLTRREKRAFLAYGLIAMAYSLSYTWLMLLFVRGVLVRNFREAGMFVFLVFFVYLTRKHWTRLFGGLRYLALEKGGFARRRPAAAAAVIAVLVLAAIVPFPHSVTVEAMLTPASEGIVDAPFDGTLEEILVRPGQSVRAGEVVGVLREAADAGDPLGDALADRAAANAAAAIATARERGGRRDLGADGEARARRRGDATVARAEAAVADERADQAWLVAPVGGRVLTNDPRGLVGRRFDAGAPVLRVGETDSLTVRFVASERVIGDLAVGEIADIRLRALPGRRVHAAIVSLDAAPADAAVLGASAAALVDPDRPSQSFLARGRIHNADGALRPGMTGRARIATQPLNLVQRAGRTYARLVRADFWL